MNEPNCLVILFDSTHHALSGENALKDAGSMSVTTVITIETDLFKGVPGYAWWEVPVSEVAEIDSVKEAYQNYKDNKMKQRFYLKGPERRT